jgi:cytoskeletal protein CcmA (bactofilin family)
MLGQKEKSTVTTNTNINVLSEGTILEGDLRSKGDLRIDGEVKGNVTTEGRCIVGVTGSIKGIIKARDCDISGNAVGDVNVSDLLLIKATGKVDGDINTSKLVLENGGEFNGTCSMGNAISMKKENIQTDAQQATG